MSPCGAKTNLPGMCQFSEGVYRSFEPHRGRCFLAFVVPFNYRSRRQHCCQFPQWQCKKSLKLRGNMARTGLKVVFANGLHFVQRSWRPRNVAQHHNLPIDQFLTASQSQELFAGPVHGFLVALTLMFTIRVRFHSGMLTPLIFLPATSPSLLRVANG